MTSYSKIIQVALVSAFAAVVAVYIGTEVAAQVSETFGRVSEAFQVVNR